MGPAQEVASHCLQFQSFFNYHLWEHLEIVCSQEAFTGGAPEGLHSTQDFLLGRWALPSRQAGCEREAGRRGCSVPVTEGSPWLGAALCPALVRSRVGPACPNAGLAYHPFPWHLTHRTHQDICTKVSVDICGYVFSFLSSLPILFL